MNKALLRSPALIVIALAIALNTSYAAIVVNFTLSAPGVQQSPLQGQTGSFTETFNSLNTGLLPASGTLAIGSYTSTGISIFNADAWGGAGGTGRYASTGSSKTLSVTLNPSRYLGFWWSAGNSGNLVRIYGAGSTLLATFDSTVIPALIGPKNAPNNVLAADGQTYSGALYYGNPNGSFGTPASLNEPYAYVNLRLSDRDATFSRIDLTGPGFEFDNLTVSSAYYDPAAAPIPEPGTWAAAALLVGAAGYVRWRKRAGLKS